MGEPDFYTTFEHTADLGIEVRGSSLKELFENAAKAVFAEMAGKVLEQANKGPLTVKVSAPNLEELLVRWLDELLYLGETKEMIFTKFEITNMSEDSIEARVWGVDYSEAAPELEIKAVTYHDLKLEKTEDGYMARFIADI